MKKKNIIARYEHELMITLLVIMTASIVALSLIVNAQGKALQDTQELLEQIAELQFEDLDVE